MRDHGGELTFSPRLPAALTRLKFRLMFRGASLHVEVDHGHARYSVVDGQSLEIHHHGEQATVEPDKTLELAIPRLPARPAAQPAAGTRPDPAAAAAALAVLRGSSGRDGGQG